MKNSFLTNNFYDCFHKESSLLKRKLSCHDFTYGYITEFLSEPLLKKNKKGKLLDIGCGIGNIALYVCDKFSKVVGIDISKRAIQIAKTNAIRLRCVNTIFLSGTIDDIQNEKFDFIVCTEVIEHVKDDKVFLIKVANMLNNDGVLLLSTPINESIFYKIGIFRKFDKEVGHLRRYETSEIEKMIKGQGMSIIKSRKVEGPIRSVVFTSKAKFLVRFIRWPISKIVYIFDEILGVIFGYSNIIILARKK